MISPRTRARRILAFVAALAVTLAHPQLAHPVQGTSAGPVPSIEADGNALSPKLRDGRQRAFATAEGFGAAAVGGRGGRVIYVTSTAESGPGSLRACIDATGPRNCVFRIAGTITLDDKPLVIREPFISILGQTAPGGGIAIRNGPKQIRPSLSIETHDVIIRHVRIRPGPHKVYSCCSGALGLYTREATDIMLDHVSLSWGSDETIDSEDASNFTLQWSLIGEPLLDGGPGKRNRARNALFTKGGNITVHHNLFAGGLFRNPQVKTADPGSTVDIVNNVHYSPEWQYVVTLGDEWARMQANLVGNYKVEGKKLRSDRLLYLMEESDRGFAIYLHDNYDETYRRQRGQPEVAVLPPRFRHYAVGSPFPAPPIRTSSPQQAYREVLEAAGATKPRRDAVDERLVREVLDRSGKLLENDPEEVGGWPVLEGGTPYPDADKDGIDDRWELQYELEPGNPADGVMDADTDGWTNFEEFMQELAGDP